MKQTKKIFLKIVIALGSIIFFVIIFFIGLYYYDNFLKKGENNQINYDVENNNININKKDNIKKINIIKNIDDKDMKNEEEKTEIKDGNKSQEEKKELNGKEKNISKNNNSDKNKESINSKITYLLQDKKKLYFGIKFINRSFFFYKENKDIIIIDLGNQNSNLILRNNYKEKIRNIYNEKDLLNKKILDNINNIILSNKIEGDYIKEANVEYNYNQIDTLLKSFLSWFLNTKSGYKIYASDIVKYGNLKVWYNYMLYGHINITYNVNKILFINNVYNNKKDLLDNILSTLKDKEDNLLFINFTSKEISYFFNYFVNKLKETKQESVYNVNLLEINNNDKFNVYMVLRKLTYYINNKYNKESEVSYIDIIKELSKKNNLIKNIFYAYYKQIRKYNLLSSSFKIYDIYYINNKKEEIPVIKKEEIERILEKLTDKIIIEDILEDNFIKEKK